jgi:hypothetical protein
MAAGDPTLDLFIKQWSRGNRRSRCRRPTPKAPFFSFLGEVPTALPLDPESWGKK